MTALAPAVAVGTTGRPTPVVGDLTVDPVLGEAELPLVPDLDRGATTGRGLVSTWPTSLPRWLGVQIDHVLTPGGMRLTSVDVLDLSGSDHRAVLARVVE